MKRNALAAESQATVDASIHESGSPASKWITAATEDYALIPRELSWTDALSGAARRASELSCKSGHSCDGLEHQLP